LEISVECNKKGGSHEKIYFFTLIILILTACNSTTISLVELDELPENVEEKMDQNATLQKINSGEKVSYIVYKSRSDVEGTFEKEGTKLIVKLNESGEGDEEKAHFFRLTKSKDADVEYMEVQINGEPVPFDVIVISGE
jgi:hypothetical protein